MTSLSMAASAAEMMPPTVTGSAGGKERGVLTLGDYVGADGTLHLRLDRAETYADPVPCGLFVHPVWLRTYDAGDLIVVEGLSPGLPRLVFARAGSGLVHQGRLFRLDASLVDGLGQRLLTRTGAAFAVFEDVEIVGTLPARSRRLMFHYQNNWRLNLRGGTWTAKQLVSGTKRKARALRREVPYTSIAFEPGPSRTILKTIAEFGRSRFEARGRRYGIDAQEVERSTKVAAEVGHGTRVRSGETLLAADLTCIVDTQAYFLTHGFHPDYPRHRLGMVCLINSIEACAACGVHDFHLLWGDQPYKAHLGAERVPLKTIVLLRSPLTALHPSCVATILRFGWLDLKRRLKPYLTRSQLRKTAKK